MFHFQIKCHQRKLCKKSGHSLGETPSVIILKNRSIVENWPVYHHKIASAPETSNSLLGKYKYLELIDTNASGFIINELLFLQLIAFLY